MRLGETKVRFSEEFPKRTDLLEETNTSFMNLPDPPSTQNNTSTPNKSPGHNGQVPTSKGPAIPAVTQTFGQPIHSSTRVAQPTVVSSQSGSFYGSFKSCTSTCCTASLI